MPMRVLEDQGVRYTELAQARKQYTAQGVAEDLGVPVAQVVKAMLVHCSDGLLALVVIPGDMKLSLKKGGAGLKDKSVALAQARDVQRITGYQVGAVSVVGFRRRDVPRYLDRRVLDLEQVVISSGRPDLGLALLPAELLRVLQGGEVGDFCQDG